MRKKRIIWSNLDINVKDWKDAYIEHLECNDLPIPEKIDDSDVLNWAYDTNSYYLDDEFANLDKIIDVRILIIGDIGRWNGRTHGYKIVESQNIKDILYSECDYCEWYSDGYNIHFTGHHHDGTNHYLYRVIREDRDIYNLLDDIYNGREISKRKLNYYTRSLHKYIAQIYGW